MKTAGIAAMGAAAVIFLTALLLLTAGHFSLLWVILLVVSPFVFILGVPVCDRFRSGVPADRPEACSAGS